MFVPTDLAFLGTDSHTLRSTDSDLLPFIAHDRAGFGGALLGDSTFEQLLPVYVVVVTTALALTLSKPYRTAMRRPR